MSTAISSRTISTFPDPQAVGYSSRHELDACSPPLSSSSSGSESEPTSTSLASGRQSSRKTRLERPRMAERQRSSSIIIPKGLDVYQRERPQYAPDDARAMSPRRTSEDLERLEVDVRKSLQDKAHTLQSSLRALAHRIDEVRQDHDRLENENRLLQDYIGEVTRSMSKDTLGRSSSVRKGKK